MSAISAIESPTAVTLAALFNEVFPANLSPSRLRNNPPPERADVLDALRKAACGANGDELPGRAAHYLLNAGCITERRIWRDGGRERAVSLTPQGASFLAALETEEHSEKGSPIERPF